MCPHNEHVCPPWLSFMLTNVFRRMFHNPRKILDRFVKSGDIALDVGCGPGYFTIPMAEMVGERGLVIAADINQGMLDRVKRRAEKAGVLTRIRLQLSEKNQLRIGQRVDFALAFWMAHEVRDLERFFAEIQGSLKSGAVFLLIEPKIHVTEKSFGEIVATAERAGLKQGGEESIRLSRAVIFRNSQKNAEIK